MSSDFLINFPVLVLIGPTAIGKTSLSLHLAHRFDCEIISMDSMQIYRHMDIGTAKIKEEEMENIPHHLLNVVNPDEDYDAGRYVKDTLAAIRSINERGKMALITGGTGLYLRSLTHGLVIDIPTDREIREKLQQQLDQQGADTLFAELQQCDSATAARIHKNDHYRLLRALEIYHLTGVPWSEHIRSQQKKKTKRFSNLLEIGLSCDRRLLYKRIDKRTGLMKEKGLEQEVRALMDMGYHPGLKSMKALGYRHVINYLEGIWQEDEAFRLLARDTRHYAKRQYTWFNKSRSVQWFNVSCMNEIVKKISDWRSGSQSLVM